VRSIEAVGLRDLVNRLLRHKRIREIGVLILVTATALAFTSAARAQDAIGKLVSAETARIYPSWGTPWN